MSSLPSERAAVLATINPIDAQTTARTSNWTSLKQFDRAMAIVLAGNITGTIDAKLQQATDSSGTGAKDIANKAVNTFAATDDNEQAVINVRGSELDLDNGFDHIALVVTPTGGTANVISGILLGFDPRFGPASDNDATTVNDIAN